MATESLYQNIAGFRTLRVTAYAVYYALIPTAYSIHAYAQYTGAVFAIWFLKRIYPPRLYPALCMLRLELELIAGVGL